MSTQKKWLLGLSISTVSLAILCAILTTWLIFRPVQIKTIKTTEDRVVFEFGDGRKFSAPGDGVIQFEGDIDRLINANMKHRTDSADAKGVEFSSWGDSSKFVLEMDFGLPETTIDGGATSLAGYANLGVKALFSNGATPLYVIGGIAIIIGAVLIFWLKAFKMGLGFAAGGASLVMLGMFFTKYPWVLWIFFLAAAAGIGFLIWDYWKKRNIEQTNEAIVAAGEGLPDKMKRLFTKLVSAEADIRGIRNTTKKVVQNQKNKNAIPRARVDISHEEKEIADEFKNSSNSKNVQ